MITNNSNNHSRTVNDGLVRPLLVHGSDVEWQLILLVAVAKFQETIIVGYFSAGYGLDIHAEYCINLVKLRKQLGKYLLVDWADDVSSDFQVALNLEVMNRHRAIADLTRAL